LLQTAASHLLIPAGQEILASVAEFIVERFRNVLLDSGARYDVVEAVLALQGHNPARANRAVHDLAAWVSRPDWNTILPAYARCVRIVRSYQEVFIVQPEALVEPAEIALWEVLQQAEKTSRAEGAVDDFLNAFLPLIPAVNRFFEAVLVMAEDDRLRYNRLGLLQRIAALRHGSADLSKLEGF
jgi:glycyl-tRNA synthetase beta subunit